MPCSPPPARPPTRCARSTPASARARRRRHRALYAFDPDTGRLAITTPTYNTAIVSDNRGAFPYGGLDLARLFDARQEPVANIGGRPPAAFGVVVRARGRVVLATQDGARHTAIRGVAAHPSARRAYAGPFTALRVSGTARAGARSARSAYRFTPTAIDARWTVKADAGDRVAATFPSWGAATALTATLTDGTRVQLDATPLPLARIARLEVGSGYTDHAARARSRRRDGAGRAHAAAVVRSDAGALDRGPVHRRARRPSFPERWGSVVSSSRTLPRSFARAPPVVAR